MEVDITEEIPNTETGASGADDDGDEPFKEIELPVEDEVKVDKPDSSGGGDGGFDGNVDGWGDDEEVILPVN